MDDANRRDADRGTAAIVTGGDSRRIASLMKFPQRLETRMHALPTGEHFPSDARVRDIPLLMIARATAIVRSVSSVVSPMRHSCFELPV